LVPWATSLVTCGRAPATAGALRTLGVLVLLFAVFVVVFGAMRHTTRQAHYDQFFQERVASGHAPDCHSKGNELVMC